MKGFLTVEIEGIAFYVPIYGLSSTAGSPCPAAPSPVAVDVAPPTSHRGMGHLT